ncbi:MAG: N-acetylmuramoyl-L-alanine amidase [Bacteroidetes bacterium ADurb.BinA012]|jgi:N-acetylmuramoyl-L-alanine amidase|nr:MAG: N-acetylmuramoyl-L-alanine amidase [Bacteroidetes bacterium ADurb.BinA012]
MAKRKETSLIVVHCSATRVTSNYTADQMLIDHRERGFNAHGYHFYIPKSGNRVALRPLEMVGAHVSGFNAMSVGVCYEGGLDAQGKPADTRNAQQKEALLSLLKELKAIYPEATIVGHRDLSPDLNNNGIIEPNEWIKLCPCFDATKEYSAISSMGQEQTPKEE